MASQIRYHSSFQSDLLTKCLYVNKIFFLFLFLLFLVPGDSSPEVKSLVTIDVHKAKELVHHFHHQYIDVRTTEEYKRGHIDFHNALNIPYMFITPQGRVKNPKFLEEVLSACKKDDYLIVGCQSGVRSLDATADLLKAGFQHVSNMGGGYAAWVENGLAVYKPNSDEL